MCVLSWLAFALAPALHATRMTIPLGVIDRASSRPSRFHLRGLLLATQIAACTALLAGASLVTRGGPAAVERIRATTVALRPAVRLSVQPLRASVRKYLEESMGAALARAIGLLGLALAAVGVFGVFAYAVEERRREIGVRLALGAARGHIVRMLVSSSGRAMIAGLAAGLLLSLACGPVLRSYLFGLSALDPIAYGLVVTMLATAALFATFLPARRACRVDPAVTLRDE